MTKELQQKLVQFVEDMRDSTRHAAILGCSAGLNESMIFKDACELLELVKSQSE